LEHPVLQTIKLDQRKPLQRDSRRSHEAEEASRAHGGTTEADIEHSDVNQGENEDGHGDRVEVDVVEEESGDQDLVGEGKIG